MTYQQPGNWSDPSWPSQTPGNDPKSPYDPVSGYPATGYPPGSPAGYPPGSPAGYPAGYPAGAPAPGYGYPVVPAQPTNGLAIAAMVVSILGALGLCGYGLGGYLGIVGAIMGHVARRQIRERGEAGDGMALAGVIVGWIAFGIAVIATVLIIIFVVWAANQDPSTYDGTTY
ncbi:MAG TPA: DUF4190 domain-containing protein [Micromonosporaceae bacterium]|nr:DUF4190 domain-containing protein [Micromonosporaceae bacterium]